MSQRISDLAVRLTAGVDSESARARRIHDFVRDRVAFGFAPGLLTGCPERTLDAGVGACAGQGALFIALLRSVGLDARQHFVVIDRGILRGALPGAAYRLLPWEISHSYTRVRIGRRWHCLDSYVIDPPLWHAGLRELFASGRSLGFGVHRLGTNIWDGESDAFAQLATADIMLADHGAFDLPQQYYESDLYRHQGGVLRIDAALALEGEQGKLAARRVNRHLDRLREKWSATPPATRAAGSSSGL